ncbi:unnamed protein product [Amoebophrya sp. A120]|nr:unnamed protein product [Amoebophrya sp. A120]|eukprot:GSA120T00005904001.1
MMAATAHPAALQECSATGEDAEEPHIRVATVADASAITEVVNAAFLSDAFFKWGEHVLRLSPDGEDAKNMLQRGELFFVYCERLVLDSGPEGAAAEDVEASNTFDAEKMNAPESGRKTHENKSAKLVASCTNKEQQSTSRVLGCIRAQDMGLWEVPMQKQEDSTSVLPADGQSKQTSNSPCSYDVQRLITNIEEHSALSAAEKENRTPQEGELDHNEQNFPPGTNQVETKTPPAFLHVTTLGFLAVSPKAAGRGIGSKLVAAVERWTKRRRRGIGEEGKSAGRADPEVEKGFLPVASEKASVFLQPGSVLIFPTMSVRPDIGEFYRKRGYEFVFEKKLPKEVAYIVAPDYKEKVVFHWMKKDVV